MVSEPLVAEALALEPLLLPLVLPVEPLVLPRVADSRYRARHPPLLFPMYDRPVRGLTIFTTSKAMKVS